MSNVLDFNRIQLDRAIKQWEETGVLEYDHTNEKLVEMVTDHFSNYISVCFEREE